MSRGGDNDNPLDFSHTSEWQEEHAEAQTPPDRGSDPSRIPGAYEQAQKWKNMGPSASGREPNPFDLDNEYEYAGAGDATYWAKHAKTGRHSTAPLAPNEDGPYDEEKYGPLIEDPRGPAGKHGKPPKGRD